MPAGLKVPDASPSPRQRRGRGRAALAWGAALAAVVAGALWLRSEQDTHGAMQALAMNSRAGMSAVPAAAPLAGAPQADTRPPLVLLPPEPASEPEPAPIPRVAKKAEPAPTVVKLSSRPLRAAQPARKTLTAKKVAAKPHAKPQAAARSPAALLIRQEGIMLAKAPLRERKASRAQAPRKRCQPGELARACLERN